MRHDVDWVQRTHDALEHLHENIAQPIIFRGYDTKDKMWREFVLSPKQTVNDVAGRDSEVAKGVVSYLFNKSKSIDNA